MHKSYPLTPALSPQGGEGEREQIGGRSKPEFDSDFQVGVQRKDTSVSPLSHWERVRVRGLSDSEFDSGLSGRRIAQKHLNQSPLPLGEG
ncbi:hypothetical protein CQ009_17175 [Pseudomonas sp. MYb2]|nr:hypothetical protein CQ025_14260 [Pseudomonas sp. MYb3]PRC32994.1 hypothetical protein CQ009_17175 [Pseudomonas sp. MYb2]